MDMIDKIREELEHWLKTGEIRFHALEETTEEHWKSYFDSELKKIENTVSADPSGAFSHLVTLSDFASRSSEKHPLVVRAITGFMKRMVHILGRVRELMGAQGFSITVSVPFDLSLTLSFD